MFKVNDMMKIYILCLNFLMISHYALAEAICLPPEVEIHSSSTDPKIKRDLGAVALRNYADNLESHPNSNGIMMGLYEPQVQMSGRLRWGNESNIKGQMHICVSKVIVDVNLNPVIHIAKEVSANSCPDGVAVEHEMLHHKDAVKFFLTDFEVFSRKAWKADVFSASDSESAKKLAEDYLKDYMTTINGDQTFYFVKSQKEIDSMSSYEKLGDLCESETLNIIAARVKLKN